MKKGLKITLIVGSLLLAGGGTGGYFYWKHTKNEKVHYSTVDLKRGAITYGITATGNLNDSLVINVGTQVSGIITQIFVDFNDIVRPGQVIAMIDTIPLATQVTDAVAALYKAQSTLVQQQKEFDRYKELLARKAVGQSDYDVQEASYDAALSAVQGAQADLKRAKMNLGYATITAPIKGIVINRAVTIGQTVAASFNTPTLFAIGNDPHIMQITANIDEADIGWIKQGQDVDFTVETYPDRVYHGKVFQVRLQSIMNQNVVTYNVMINLVNEDLTLIPGMTATLTVKVAEHKDVLVVPMTALLFNPSPTDTLVPSADHNKQTIWVMCDSASAARSNGRCIDMKGTMMYCDTVKRILDDGVMAEIQGADLHEGMKIVTGIVKEQQQKLKSLLPTTTQQRTPQQPARPGGK
jgi:HlyD family secretion protein